MVKIIDKRSIINFAEQVLNSLSKDCYENLLDLFIQHIGSKEEFEMFIKELKCVRNCLINDLDLFMISDPAADSKEEVIVAYPGFKAISYYRVAHILYKLNLKIQARIISEQAHFLTGIDIHPGATIGCPFFIDHGTGIVIGETTIIGDRVKIYQGVTLGALSLSKGSQLKGVKRHPTIKNDVTIYSGASILGDVTIGDNVTIGSNVFLLESIPDNYKVTLNKPKLVLTIRK